MQHAGKGIEYFLSALQPCPYLPGQVERKAFASLVGRSAQSMHDVLSHYGFRRSQSFIYRPVCPSCNACQSLRVPVDDFLPNDSQARCLKTNADVHGKIITAVPTQEQYALFRSYLDARHPHDSMASMSVLDYVMMVEESHVQTRLVEYRIGSSDKASKHAQTQVAHPVGTSVQAGELVAVALTDVLDDGLSMVYGFYETEEAKRSLGTFLILDHIRRAKMLGLKYVYLGFHVEGSRKMAYKANFMPHEKLTPEGWQRFCRETSKAS